MLTCHAHWQMEHATRCLQAICVRTEVTKVNTFCRDITMDIVLIACTHSTSIQSTYQSIKYMCKRLIRAGVYVLHLSIHSDARYTCHLIPPISPIPYYIPLINLFLFDYYSFTSSSLFPLSSFLFQVIARVEARRRRRDEALAASRLEARDLRRLLVVRD